MSAAAPQDTTADVVLPNAETTSSPQAGKTIAIAVNAASLGIDSVLPPGVAAGAAAKVGILNSINHLVHGKVLNAVTSLVSTVPAFLGGLAGGGPGAIGGRLVGNVAMEALGAKRDDLPPSDIEDLYHNVKPSPVTADTATVSFEAPLPEQKKEKLSVATKKHRRTSLAALRSAQSKKNLSGKLPVSETSTAQSKPAIKYVTPAPADTLGL